MRRFMPAAIGLAALLAASIPSGPARAQGEAQIVVDRATLALQEMLAPRDTGDRRWMLQRARAVMVCPQVFKAGFIFAGSGGDCLLLARSGNGTWSYPAFYGVGSGSVGFQIGVEDSAIVMMIMTRHGLNAVMDSQFKLGADASIAVASIGSTVGGATTAAVGADIVVYAENRGAFGGVSLEGSIMTLRSEWNARYYGQPYGARQIVEQMAAANRGADPLREILTRYGTPTAIPISAEQPPPMGPGGPGPGYAPSYPPQGYQQPGYPPANQPPPYPQAYQQQSYPPPTQQSYQQSDPGYGGLSQGQGGQPIQLQPNAPVQQQQLAPAR